MSESRIQLTDNAHDILYKMSEGNPGALTVCIGMLKEGELIDPQGFMGGLGAVLLLDTFRIYGCRIWMLYKDVCKQSMVLTLAAIRSVQLGHTPEAVLHAAIDNRINGFDAAEAHRKVRETLPEFAVYVDRESETTESISSLPTGGTDGK